MRLMTKEEYPDIYNCGLLSLCMILKYDPYLVKKAMPDPNSLLDGERRGFLYCDAQAFLMKSEMILGLIEKRPMAMSLSGNPVKVLGDLPELRELENFFQAIKGRRGLLCSDNHVVAWDGELCYDPGNGEVFGLRTSQCLKFNPREAWLIAKL